MTLNSAKDRFRDKPSIHNALVYLETACTYWEDQMISWDSLMAIFYEVNSWIETQPDLATTPSKSGPMNGL